MTIPTVDQDRLFISGRVVEVSRRESGLVSNRKVASEILSVTRDKTEMNLNLVAPPLYIKSQNAQSVCVVAARIGRCWNDLSLKHSGS